MPIFKIRNVGANQYLNIYGSNVIGVNLINNLYNVTVWPASDVPEQMWYLPMPYKNITTYVRPYISPYMKKEVGLNIVTTSGNCNIHTIADNEHDSQVEIINGSTSDTIKIRLKNYPDKYLTADKADKGANVSWCTASSVNNSNLQVWKLEPQYIVDFSGTDTVYAVTGKYTDTAANFENASNKFKMNTNAKYIYGFLKNKGFTKSAICAMLGNMQTESSINPGIWESRSSSGIYSVSGGYGVAQLTPAQDFLEWCYRINLITNTTAGAINQLCAAYPQALMDAELQYILWECEALGGTFYPGDKGTLLGISTFSQFKKYNVSNESEMDKLSDVFCSYFERPDPPVDYDSRQTNAWSWYASL